MLQEGVADRKAKELSGLPKRRVLVVDEDLDDLLLFPSSSASWLRGSVNGSIDLERFDDSVRY